MFLTRVFEEGVEKGGVDPRVLVYLAIFLVVFLLMVILGWLASSRGWLKQEAEPQPAAHGHDEHAHAEAPQVQSAHAERSVGLSAGPDDLTILEGIGPKVARVLAGVGITTFDGLAKADIVKLKATLDAAGYTYMDPAGWIEQAVLAAKGDMAGLKKLQTSLKGGRKVA